MSNAFPNKVIFTEKLMQNKLADPVRIKQLTIHMKEKKQQPNRTTATV